MSIEKSLGHGFPIITVGGEPYHYGRENTFGKYLVEHVHDAKDCWCFDKQEDLIAFLLQWPMTPERKASFRRLPDGTKVKHERRGENVDHERPDPIKGIPAMCPGQSREPIILQRDNEGSGEYAVFTDPMHRDDCDDVMV